MKVSLATRINLSPDIVWAKVQTASLLTHIAWPLVRFEPVGDEPFDTFKSGGRYQVKLRLFGIVPFSPQWIVISVHVPETGELPKRLRDNGHSPLISTWDHWITVSPDTEGGTLYSDDVDIRAGLLTPFIWMFAQVFYRHRQRRWRSLAPALPAGLKSKV